MVNVFVKSRKGVVLSEDTEQFRSKVVWAEDGGDGRLRVHLENIKGGDGSIKSISLQEGSMVQLGDKFIAFEPKGCSKKEAR